MPHTHGGHGGGHGYLHGGGHGSYHGGRHGFFHRGRWQGRRWQGISGGAPPAPDPQVQWAQSCLAQLVDPSVPQNGFMGPQTRQAIQTFQQQQQLPTTGMLDPNTVTALQTACAQGGASQQAGQPSQPGGQPGPPPGPPHGHPQHEVGAAGYEGEFPFDRPFDIFRRDRFPHDRDRWRSAPRPPLALVVTGS